eukprot:NODE_538_length_6306_cov_1.301273.p1 type:complete len:857 gc:universal NODE_538_length_6306_cov_1.301273:1392-3962(+)
MGFVKQQHFRVFKDMLVTEYRHQNDCRLLHFKPNEDLNQKGLLIKLNTYPDDNTGLFHILEHVVLCGSKRYPIRDPFMKLVQRNLAYEMNACTGMDLTYYYAVSDHYKDIRNIYMDALLNGNVSKYDFMQEGWYFDKEIKGVVYNEMKGAMSDINSFYYRDLFKKLFPKSLYSFNSGGDPLEIPNLTYEKFLRKYKQFYHPSNMTIMVYGNLNIETELSWFDSQVTGFQKQQLPESKFPHCVAAGSSHSVAPLQNNLKFSSVNYDLGNLDHFEKFCMMVLAKYLLHLNQSPLYQSLIGPVGNAYTPGTGFHDSPVSWFSVGVQHDNFHNIKPIISQLVNHKIDITIVSSILNQYKLQYMHNTPHSASEWMEAAISTQHDYKDLLQVDKYIERLEKAPEILQSFMAKLITAPIHEYRLESKFKVFEPIKININMDGDIKKLKEYQKKEDDLSVLPTTDPLSLAVPDLHKLHKQDEVYWNQSNTDLNYYAQLYDLGISIDLVPYLPLFCSSLTKLDTEHKNEDMALNVRRFTSGIAISPMIITNTRENSSLLKLYTASYTHSNIKEMTALLNSTILRAKFDNDRARTEIKKLLQRSITNFKNGIPQMGHMFALKHSNQFCSVSGKLDEFLTGLSQYLFLLSLNEVSVQEICDKFAEIQTNIKMAKLKHYIAGKNRFETTKGGSLTSKLFDNTILETYKKVPLKLDLPVNYLGQAQYVVPYEDKKSPIIALISRVMNPYLHVEIREKGGAYGGSSSFNSLYGLLGFYTYRDPNVNFKHFSDAIQQLSKIGQKDLDLAKWSLLRDMDKPIAINKKGMQEFLYNITSVKERHNRIKMATKDDLLEVQHELLNQKSFQTILN